MPSPGFWIGLGQGVQGAGQTFAGLEQEKYRRQQQQIQNDLAQKKFEEEQARNEQLNTQYAINQRPPGTTLTPEEVAQLVRTGNSWAYQHQDPTLGSTPLQGQGAGLSNMPMSPEDVLSIAQPQGDANLPPMAGHDARDVSVGTEDAKYRASLMAQQMRQQQFYDNLARQTAQGNRGLDIRQTEATNRGEHWNDMESIARIIAGIQQQNANTNAGRMGNTDTHAQVVERLQAEKLINDMAEMRFPSFPPGMPLTPERQRAKEAWIANEMASRGLTSVPLRQPAPMAPMRSTPQGAGPIAPMASHAPTGAGPQRQVGPTPSPEAARRIRVMDELRRNGQKATDANVDAFLARYPDFP